MSSVQKYRQKPTALNNYTINTAALSTVFTIFLQLSAYKPITSCRALSFFSQQTIYTPPLNISTLNFTSLFHVWDLLFFSICDIINYVSFINSESLIRVYYKKEEPARRNAFHCAEKRKRPPLGGQNYEEKGLNPHGVIWRRIRKRPEISLRA